jgi:CRP/FNR family transcriptional regulator
MSNLDEVVDFKSINNSCKSCHSAKFCLVQNLKDKDLMDFNSIVKRRKPLQRGERLFQSGDVFHSVYIVHSGSVKITIESSDGEQQITGFYFPGDLVGVDGFENSSHVYTVETLETSSFCEISVKQFEAAAKKIPLLQQQFFKLISREIRHEQELMLLLGRMDSRRRLASFLVAMSSQLQAQGYSSHSINLSMTRHDIANYLGLAIETVSRLLTTFQNNDVLDVMRRNITIKDQRKLHGIAENRPEEECMLEKSA